jgi:hypothetical protein
VYGYAYATTGYTYGVYGYTRSTSGRGVLGYAYASTGTTYGVYGYNRSTSGRGVYGYADYIGVYGYSYRTSGTGYGVYGYARSGYAMYAAGNMRVTGNFSVGGIKAAVVRLKNGEGITLYAEESAENWFVDYGVANLKDGKAVVKIDPVFAQTVNTNLEYHVVLTPKGDCKGLYVTGEGLSSFEVRELNGGKSNISFSYRIAAKRKGYETQRLAVVEKDDMTAMVEPVIEEDHSADELAFPDENSG